MTLRCTKCGTTISNVAGAVCCGKPMQAISQTAPKN